MPERLITLTCCPVFGGHFRGATLSGQGLDPWDFIPDPLTIEQAAALLADDDPFSQVEEWRRPRFRMFKRIVTLAIERGDLAATVDLKGTRFITRPDLTRWAAQYAPDGLPQSLEKYLVPTPCPEPHKPEPTRLELPQVTKLPDPQHETTCTNCEKIAPHITPLMELQYRVIDRFYARLQPGDPPPKSSDIKRWLERQRIDGRPLSSNEKMAVDITTRPQVAKKGGRPAKHAEPTTNNDSLTTKQTEMTKMANALQADRKIS